MFLFELSFEGIRSPLSSIIAKSMTFSDRMLCDPLPLAVLSAVMISKIHVFARLRENCAEPVEVRSNPTAKLQERTATETNTHGVSNDLS